MKQLALQDLQNIQNVINKSLNPVLTAALTSANSPQALDRDGNQVNAYNDAQAAYKQNEIRMTGASSYVPNSLKLTLGELNTPTDTNIPVPQSSVVPPPPNSQQQNNNYLSYVDVPYKSTHFVFGGIASANRLVDLRQFPAGASPGPLWCPVCHFMCRLSSKLKPIN